MATTNDPRRGSSSSSSGEDKPAGQSSGAKPTGVVEKHLNKHCKYEKYEDTINGKMVIIHLRECICKSEYEDRSYLAESKMDLVASDGKEIHFKKACKWRRSKTKQDGNGKTVYLLTKCCGCITPTTHAPVQALNSK